MATYVLIHGAGDVGWYWHLVQAELEAAGHEVIAPDLPCDVETATLEDYAAVVLAAVGDRNDVIVAAHSFGGFTAPIVASSVPARLLLYVAGMIPTPGTSGSDLFADPEYVTEPQEDDSLLATFYHDVPPGLGEDALSRGRDQGGTAWTQPWPLDAHPDVPTRAIVGTIDRVFPVQWLKNVIRNRIGVEADEIEAGHCIALAKPVELAAWMERQRESVGA